MSKTRKAISYALDIAIIFSVIIVSLNVLNQLQLAFPVQGISMLPAIQTGDLAIIQPGRLSSFHVGDIIVYWNNLDQEYVIHRIIQLNVMNGQTTAIVKGDDNPSPDPVVVTSNVTVGKVLFLIYFVGYLIERPYNYLIASILIIALLLDYYVSRQ
ncbi:MAG: signal peptidase I [Nitrososphaerota archaeon]